MNDFEEKNVNIDEKLATTRFICDNESHIIVDIEKCKICKDKNCVYFCPANVYEMDKGAYAPVVHYENCLECGTCRICCPYGAINWNYPKGAKGVRYKFG